MGILYSNSVTLQNSDTDSNGTAMHVAGLSVVGVQISGTFGATITFNGTVDMTNWVAIQAQNLNNGAVGTSATAAGVFSLPVAGLSAIRTPISGHASGTVVVKAVGTTASAGMSLADIDITGTETVTANSGQWVEVIDVTLSLDDSSYAQHDVLAATQEVAGAGLAVGASGIIQSIVVQDFDDNGRALDFIFLDANVGIGTENAAVSVADSDAVAIIGYVSVKATDYTDMINSMHATVRNIGLPFECGAATTSIYMAVVYRDATGDTYTASGVKVKLGILQGT